MPEEESDQPPEGDSSHAEDSTDSRRRFPLGEFGDGRARGEIQTVAIVPKNSVPSTFPQDIGTLEALKLNLTLSETDDDTLTTYLPWPATGPTEEFRKLATLAGVDPEQPETLVGARILLVREKDQYIPMLPERHSRGTEVAVYGAWAGLTPSISIALLSFFGLGTLVESFFFFVLWGVGTFLVLPVSVYLDAWQLRGRTSFTGNPIFWAVICAFPPFYVVTAPYYLLFVRQNALPLVTMRDDTESKSGTD